MSQKGTQIRAQENRSAWSVGRIQDAVRQKWQQIRQKVEALVREGLDALLTGAPTRRRLTKTPCASRSVRRSGHSLAIHLRNC